MSLRHLHLTIRCSRYFNKTSMSLRHLHLLIRCLRYINKTSIKHRRHRLVSNQCPFKAPLLRQGRHQSTYRLITMSSIYRYIGRYIDRYIDVRFISDVDNRCWIYFRCRLSMSLLSTSSRHQYLCICVSVCVCVPHLLLNRWMD